MDKLNFIFNTRDVQIQTTDDVQRTSGIYLKTDRNTKEFFPFGATAPAWALAYLRKTLRFTLVY
jgi:hypothetical protein